MNFHLDSSYHVVDEVGETPNNRHTDEGYAEQYDVQKADAKHIREPYAPAVHHSSVRVHLTVRRAHIHPSWHTQKSHLTSMKQQLLKVKHK